MKTFNFATQSLLVFLSSCLPQDDEEIFRYFFNKNCNLFIFLHLLKKLTTMKTLILPFLFLLTFLISCKTDDMEVVEKKVASVDLYVAGIENNQACYWKNNVKTNLINGTGITAKKIIVENNDVYVFAINNVAPFDYYLWKNNNRINVNQYIGTNINTSNPTDYNHNVNDFLIDQGNIYLFGSIRSPITYSPSTGINSYTREICYWKNGVKTVLFTENPPFLLTNITTRNTTIHNGDIYIPVNKRFNNLTDSPIEIGYFINGTYHIVLPYSNQTSFRHISKGTNSVYLSIYDQSINKTYYKNLLTNTDSYFSQTVKGKFTCDGNDIYDFSNGQNYLKNDLTIFSNYSSGFDNIEDLLAINQNVYQIRSKIVNDKKESYKVYINDTEVQQINVLHGIFTSLFVVPN